MELSHIILLEGNSHCVSIRPTFAYCPYLTITLECLTGEISEQDTELSGFVEVLYKLNDQEETRRFSFNKQDFTISQINGVYSKSICLNTGDLIKRIRIFFSYKLPEGMLMDILLKSNRAPLNVKTVNFDPCNRLDYLEIVRSMNGENFKDHLTREIHALEAPSDKGSMATFKKWVLTDKIIRLSGVGELPLTYLEEYALNWCDDYDAVKNQLGFSEIVV